MTINIVEVGPRDGLQNVKETLSVDQKEALIECLMAKGFSDIEGGAFVRPDRVPQMADSDQLATRFKHAHANLWYLVPNLKGLERALELGVTQMAFFTSVSQTFNQKNIGMTTEESMDVIFRCLSEIRDQAYHFITDWNQKPESAIDVKVRLYISTVIECPYEGPINPSSVVAMVEEFSECEIAQISLGDTIGKGDPTRWKRLLKDLAVYDSTLAPSQRIAMHCHDTNGKALHCVGTGLEEGVTVFDASIGGLGGCPFAPGASGNLATEDLVDFLERNGVDSPVKLADLLDVFDVTRTGHLTNRSRLLSI